MAIRGGRVVGLGTWQFYFSRAKLRIDAAGKAVAGQAVTELAAETYDIIGAPGVQYAPLLPYDDAPTKLATVIGCGAGGAGAAPAPAASPAPAPAPRPAAGSSRSCSAPQSCSMCSTASRSW